jgi:hypothetical protein
METVGGTGSMRAKKIEAIPLTIIGNHVNNPENSVFSRPDQSLPGVPVTLE